MATKDDKPSLLSKVAMFVRNPTRDWSELDQPVESDAAGYDKQALKAMIERKRQNDFVRKREFDQLRKLRSRGATSAGPASRPSFFHSSLSFDGDGRAVTLKKIDEIEAQMSRQWWKAKQGEGDPSAPGSEPPDNASAPSVNPDDSQYHSGLSAYATTRPIDQLDAPIDARPVFATTQAVSSQVPRDATRPPTVASAPARSPLPPAAPPVPPSAGKLGGAAGVSSSRMQALVAGEMATDPELEEAAIRFANGDDAGAERALLASLREPQAVPLSAQSWLAALLDCYRVTGRRAGFQKALEEFAVYLEGEAPVWSPIGARVPAPRLPVAKPPPPVGVADWLCPERLLPDALESLRSSQLHATGVLTLDWAALRDIAPESVPLLDRFFMRVCNEPVQQRWLGSEALVRALRAITPSGDRSVDRSWWRMRLNALRAMGMQDDFELAALDHCITYEVSPAEWADAASQIELPGAPAADRPLAPAPLPSLEPVALAPDGQSLLLQGEILGDASDALAALDGVQLDGARWLIDCDTLVRVDFAAAGSILNWAASRHSEGRQLVFQNVHRLVAAFFHVIGINEYAQVIPRPL